MIDPMRPFLSEGKLESSMHHDRPTCARHEHHWRATIHNNFDVPCTQLPVSVGVVRDFEPPLASASADPVIVQYCIVLTELRSMISPRSRSLRLTAKAETVHLRHVKDHGESKGDIRTGTIKESCYPNWVSNILSGETGR